MTLSQVPSTTGIVRNLLNQTFYLRVPTSRDRPGSNRPIAPKADIELDFQDWGLVINELIPLDQKNILRIIRYPGAGGGGATNIYYGPTPPSDTSNLWFSSVTGDYYIYDTTIGSWRSLSYETVPFFRNPVRGQPLGPYGAQYSSYPLYVNQTTSRNYMVYRLFAYVNDRSMTPIPHQFTLKSPGSGDETFTINSGTTNELLPTTPRILIPGSNLEIRHEPGLDAFYMNVTVELSHVYS